MTALSMESTKTRAQTGSFRLFLHRSPRDTKRATKLSGSFDRSTKKDARAGIKKRRSRATNRSSLLNPQVILLSCMFHVKHFKAKTRERYTAKPFMKPLYSFVKIPDEVRAIM